MRKPVNLILAIGLAVALCGCGEKKCDCPEPPKQEAAREAPAPIPAPAPTIPGPDEIGWDFTQRVLKPLGRELEYVKLAVKPDRLAEVGASDFHAFSLSHPGILLYVLEFPTPEIAAARAGDAAPALARWGLMDPRLAALRHNLVLVIGVAAGEAPTEAQLELAAQAVEIFGLGIAIDREALEGPAVTPEEVMQEPTPREEPPSAAAFLETLEAELLPLWVAQERAHWVAATYITQDTEILAAQADERVMEFMTRKASEAKAFADLPEGTLSREEARKLHLLRIANPLPAPADPEQRAELARLAASMKSTYGKGKFCRINEAGARSCYTLDEMSKIFAKSRDPEELKALWIGWRTISFPMKEAFASYANLSFHGAVEMGFANLGDLWKAGYDMPPADFQRETERLWVELTPFYKDLHCYVRGRLREQYGDVVPADGPIPAHLLGNMWAQDWTNIYDLVIPEPDKPSFDLSQALVSQGFDPRRMVKTAEAFFVSLGLPALPETFWDRSMLTRPQDRDVVCHASAWDVDWKDDLRIKMCIQINEEDFTTIHHELGHNYYQRAYRDQPTLFTNSANDGFHEALGDTISLSLTPAYLKKIGLMPEETEVSELNALMYKALEKIAFLPFGLLVDRWRWQVFAGNLMPADYNPYWWELREHFQGVAPPVERPAEAFDPGAKYHVAANVPYTRYFLAAILQFQFHSALCRVSGHEGPLHQCSIHGSEAAGQRLREMMEMGLSAPWPEAMVKLTLQEERLDSGAILEYFGPLQEWLTAENQRRGYTCGW